VRHASRVAAIQILYQLDAGNRFDDVDGAVALFFAHLSSELEGESRRYSEELCRGVVERLGEVDAALERASNNWRLERMSRVDRSVLRLAAYELLYERDIPAPVVIDEAIEIGKDFGTGESGSFINGVLNRLLHDLQPT
jgi:transcription antitermination protein NusB